MFIRIFSSKFNIELKKKNNFYDSEKGCLMDVDLSNVERKTFPVNLMASLVHISSHNPQKQHFPRSICGYVFGYFSLYSSGASTISIALLGHIFAHNPQDMHSSISCVCSPLYPSGMGIASWGNLTVIGFENRFFSSNGIIKIFIISPIHICRADIQTPVNGRYICNFCSYQ